MDVSTLAHKLGVTTHLSPLLHRAGRLGLGPADLQRLAVERGCRHYARADAESGVLPGSDRFTNEELAIALLCPALPYDPHSIRCGAAMLSAPWNIPERLARMAVRERCVSVVRHVAEAGRRFEPENDFWSRLLVALPSSKPPRSGILPHPTRFVAMTGFTRAGPGVVVEWQRPHASRTPSQDD